MPIDFTPHFRLYGKSCQTYLVAEIGAQEFSNNDVLTPGPEARE
jgi:hypothetical protein